MGHWASAKKTCLHKLLADGEGLASFEGCEFIGAVRRRPPDAVGAHPGARTGARAGSRRLVDTPVCGLVVRSGKPAEARLPRCLKLEPYSLPLVSLRMHVRPWTSKRAGERAAQKSMMSGRTSRQKRPRPWTWSTRRTVAVPLDVLCGLTHARGVPMASENGTRKAQTGMAVRSGIPCGWRFCS